MSFNAMAWAWNAPVESATQRVVLMGLAESANSRTGECFPSYAYLARHAMVTRRTVITTIKALEDKGLVEITRRHRSSNLYQLPAAAQKSPGSEKFSPSTLGGETPSPHGETDGGGVVKLTTSGGETVSPRTSKEPVIEQGREPSVASAPPEDGEVLTLKGEIIKEPKQPADDSESFKWLAWSFYLGRKELGDNHFNPWDPKILKQCKIIVEKKANGDTREAINRAARLYSLSRHDEFYDFTPGDLLSKWEKLFPVERDHPKRMTVKGQQSDDFWYAADAESERLHQQRKEEGDHVQGS